MAKRPLFYLQDPGGSIFLAPLLSRFLPQAGAIVVAHPLAEPILMREKVPFERLAIGADERAWGAFLAHEAVSGVVCTLSAQRDLTNALLITASAAAGVPCLGVMDHWKGVTRLLDQHGAPRYAPDVVLCIDEYARTPLVSLLGDSRRVRVAGHPQLERALLKRRGRAGRRRVLVISQPDAYPDGRGGTWRSVFAADSWRLLTLVALAASAAGASVAFRPHPKEQDCGPLPGGVERDAAAWDDALAAHDVVVGVDSMLLVEAVLAGRHCVSLRLPGVADHGDVALPYPIGEEVRDEAGVQAAVMRAVDEAVKGPALAPPALEHAVRGSLERGVECLNDFLSCEAAAAE